MDKVVIVEAQITDHPDYETFVEAFHNVDEAISFVKDQLLTEELEEGEEIIVMKVSDTKRHYRIERGPEVYFVTEIEVK